MKVQPTTKELIAMLYERLPELFDRAAPVKEPVASINLYELIRSAFHAGIKNDFETLGTLEKQAEQFNTTTPPAAPPTTEESSAVKPAAPAQELAEYDAGLLSDYGGGNVEWWQDYIRYELGCAYEHYKEQLAAPPAAQPDMAWIERERAVGYREGHMAALAQRQWVGLTDEEIEPYYAANKPLIKWVETKLKEKNNG
jgi:hypothetical protein